MMKMTPLEKPRSHDQAPLEQLKSVENKLRARVKAHDFEIQNLSYQQALDTLQHALQQGEPWAADRTKSLDSAVDGYISANNARRMDALLEVKEQLSAVLSDFETHRKSAA